LFDEKVTSTNSSITFANSPYCDVKYPKKKANISPTIICIEPGPVYRFDLIQADRKSKFARDRARLDLDRWWMLNR
jgi:hypothetical protein